MWTELLTVSNITNENTKKLLEKLILEAGDSVNCI